MRATAVGSLTAGGNPPTGAWLPILYMLRQSMHPASLSVLVADIRF